MKKPKAGQRSKRKRFSAGCDESGERGLVRHGSAVLLAHAAAVEPDRARRGVVAPRWRPLEGIFAEALGVPRREGGGMTRPLPCRFAPQQSTEKSPPFWM